ATITKTAAEVLERVSVEVEADTRLLPVAASRCGRPRPGGGHQVTGTSRNRPSRKENSLCSQQSWSSPTTRASPLASPISPVAATSVSPFSAAAAQSPTAHSASRPSMASPAFPCPAASTSSSSLAPSSLNHLPQAAAPCIGGGTDDGGWSDPRGGDFCQAGTPQVIGRGKGRVAWRRTSNRKTAK
ncbi:hypothetical protein MUK42_11191, partial [Musa troglodytarum]